jgi:hypothetical protein
MSLGQMSLGQMTLCQTTHGQMPVGQMTGVIAVLPKDSDVLVAFGQRLFDQKLRNKQNQLLDRHLAKCLLAK